MQCAHKAPAARPVAVRQSARVVPRLAVRPTRAAVAEAPSAAAQSTGSKRWVAVVANADFWLTDPQNESFAEVLRERVRYFGEQGRERDFFFVPNPSWLDARFPEQGKQVRRPCIALVSTDDKWVTFVKLRMDRVLRLELPADFSPEQALEAGEPLPELKMAGKWTAPYAAYAAGWHKAFYPPSAASHPF